MSSARLERVVTAMQRHIDSGEVAGLATLIARRGEVVHTAQLGMRDREAGLPMTSDTIVRIYSMTKPIVSTALMLLHEEGRFQLEHPVAMYLPAFANQQVLYADGTLVAPTRPVEIRDLLMHTSGLTYDFMLDNPVGELYRDARIMNDATRTLEECVDAIASLPLAFHPGETWHYSVGIDVAGRLIEVLSGQSLGEFLHERMFGPLGMVDTGFGVADGSLDRLAAMYGLPDLIGAGHTTADLIAAGMNGDNQRRDVSGTYPTDQPDVFQRGGLGLFSTIGDYHRFAQMLCNGGSLDGEQILGRKTLELMHTNHTPAELLPYKLLGLPVPGMGFGLGSRVMVDVGQFKGPGSVGEFGWAGAAKTYFWVDPAEELVAVFMSQYMTGMTSPDRDFRSVVYQAIVDEPRTRYPVR
ncbi:MAG: serine hydrolase domain-containing protein [Acidimicrobiales bacterium]